MSAANTSGGETFARPPKTALAVVCLVGVALVLVGHAWVYDFISDDAFIIARYARNVVDGHGWVYNVGERVEGYTSFLWVGLTAALGAVGVEFVRAVRGLSLVGGLGCILVMWLASPLSGVDRRRPLSCLGPLLFAGTGAAACWSLGGLEACGYATLILVSVWLAAGPSGDVKRMALAGVTCGLCALMRPEGVLVTVALVAWLVLVRRHNTARNPVALLIPAGVIVGAHLIWRHAYYGDWLPNTFYAKVGANIEQAQRGLEYVLGFAAHNGGLLLWLGPFVAVWLYRARPFARALSLVGLLLVAGVVAVGGDGLPMYRFMVPVIALWAMLVQGLVADALDYWRSVRDTRPGWRSYVALVLGAALLIAPLATNQPDAAQYRLYATQQNIEVPRWTAAGEWLAKNAPPDASIACVPIGAVGYYSGLRVYDMLGLTDRHIARRPAPLGEGWAGHEKHDGPYILSREPTYLLLGNILVIEQQMPLTHPQFCRPPFPAIRQREDDIFTPGALSAYESRVVELPGPLYFHFFQRRSLSLASAVRAPDRSTPPPSERPARPASERPKPAAADGPNVLLLVVDTLRCDHVGCYGSSRDTTPNVDALAADALRFTKAYATAPWTIPSVGSMLTGLYPSSTRGPGTWSPLPSERITLAEILKGQGYGTAGVVSHFLVGSRLNFQQGFDVFLQQHARGDDYVSTEGVTLQAISTLRNFATNKQTFFLFVHYFDPHYSYRAHPEYGFAAPSAGRLDGTQSIHELRDMLPDMTEEETGYLRDLYDEEIRYTDAGIGRLLDTLRELELYDDTIIVLVADHGEEFAERGWLGHTRTLYDELMRIPLIIHLPESRGAGRVVEALVSLVSLPATVLELAGVDQSGLHFQGDSFAGLIERDDAAASATIFMEAEFASRLPDDVGKETHKKAIIWGRYKLIHDQMKGTLELYDLADDPAETTDLSGDRQELVKQLRPILQQRIALARQEKTDAQEVDLTEEELDRLRELGYIE